MNKPDKISFFIYGLTRIIITTPLHVLYRLRVNGVENWPRRGPAIIASNHSSNLDPCILGVAYPGRIRWMAKIELWKIPGLGWLVEKLGGFPVHRGEPDREAIRRARSLLGQGWIVGMFPEGTRFRDGYLGEAHPGVGMLALGSGVPVIPVRIRGNEKVMRGVRLGRPQITITVGKPVDLEIGSMSKGRAYREASRRIMEAISEL